MAGVRLAVPLLALTLAGCALLPPPVPDGAYYPDPTDPRTARLARALWRTAAAAGDDPGRYAFAMLATAEVTALVGGEDGLLYLSEGLAAQPEEVIDALIARQVAHEVLGHAGQRRALSLGISGGFVALGLAVPGLGFADLVVNPLVVRAFGHQQAREADRRAVEILRMMGYPAPRRALAAGISAAAGASETDPAERLAALEPLEPAGPAESLGQGEP